MNHEQNNTPEDELERLQLRLHYLEKTDRWHMDVMNMLICMSGAFGKLEEIRSIPNIFQSATSCITQVFQFDLITFFAVNKDDSSFELAHSQNNIGNIDAEELKHSLINSGDFAWAITQNRTVQVKHGADNQAILLHVLATKSDVWGMFVGVPNETNPLSISEQNMLSVVLQNTAHALENRALYELIHEQNRRLEDANTLLEQRVEEKTIDLQKALTIAKDASDEKSLVVEKLNEQLISQQITEERLRDSEERFQLATQAADEGLWDWNLRTGEVYMSARWKALLGYQDDEIPNTLESWTNRVHPGDLSQAMMDLESYMDGKLASYDKTIRVRHRNGRYRWFKNCWMAVRDSKGNAVRIVGTVNDVTEYRKHQEEMAAAKDAAEAAARAKSDFLATMSHEIRTPMNGVLGMLQLLNRTELNDKQQSFIDTASTSGELLLTVINDILDYSKMESGKLTLESIPFSPLTLAEETTALLANSAFEKGIEFVVNLDPGLPALVRGDPVRLRQVLTNLVGNAIKFTDSGEVMLTGNYRQNMLFFSVADTGIGLDKKQQKNLFQSFTQADSTHTRKFGGTGLGLAISQRLVKAMGGNIEVSSKKGKGSTFYFSLPLKAVKIDDTTQLPEALKQTCILIVDDNETNRQVITGILNNWGIDHVKAASNAREACDLLNEAAENGAAFDVTILDMQMPDVDGMQLTNFIRNNKKLNDTKVIMFSSVDPTEGENIFDAFLRKPLQQTDMYNTLLSVIGGYTDDTPTSTSTFTQCKTDSIWFNNKPLLLVEDNHVNQAVAYEILSDAGFEVDICDNGAKAVSRVQKKDYEIVLMDIQMPVMDGLEATRTIRSLGGQYSTLPILAMTANALADDSDKSLAAGMNAHVTKPIDANLVLCTIAQWVPAESKPKDSSAMTMPEEITLPKLPGIDVEDGLGRMRGNQAAYKRVLKGFLDKQADSKEKLKIHLRNRDWDDATRLAHSLKGSGGNIGAALIYRHAAALEQACKAQDPAGAEQHLALLEPTLDEVIHGLRKLDQKATEGTHQTTGSKLDAAAFRTMLNELLSLLDNDIAEAQTTAEKLQQHMDGSQWQAQVGELAKSLNSFDIEAARAITDRLLKQSI
jgi:two-component system sensor histidine kinase/response regulator